MKIIALGALFLLAGCGVATGTAMIGSAVVGTGVGVAKAIVP